MNPSRPVRRGLLGALTATALLAAPAAAHPFVAGGELPVDSLATLRLSMAHGCGGDGGGGEAPTTEVALEVPDWLRIVEVAAAEGYASETETAADGTVTAVVWTAEGVGEPAPAFDLEVVASGTPGETRHLAVFQGCETGSYRWVGTPDEPADDPAVDVALVEADPGAPPPPAEPAAPAEEAGGDPTDRSGAPGGDVTTDDAQEPATEEPAAEEPAAEDLAAAEEDDGLPLVLLGGLVVVALAVVALLAARRRGRGNA